MLSLVPRPMAPRRFNLRVAAEERHLVEIRDFVQDAGEKLLIPQKTLVQTKLAVDEACTNVVRHGYKGASGFIEIVITGNGRDFSIAIHDTGKGFDIRNVKSPDLKMYVETRKRGGLGVFLMNQLMDEVRYRASSNGNVLTMTKRLGRSRRRKGKGKPRKSLRFQYTIQAFGAITLLVALAFSAIHWRQARVIERDAINQAKSTATSLGQGAVDALQSAEPMSPDQTHLGESVRALMKAHPEYASARVFDARGRIWASDKFEELFTVRTLPMGVHAVASGSGAKPAPPQALVEPSDGQKREVYQPILQPGAKDPRAIGWVSIAVRESAIAEEVSAARIELATIALFTLLLGCGLSAVLITIFVQPIQALSDSVRAIGEGTMVADIGTSGNEEIDEIARAFNEVTAKFRSAQSHLMEQERMQQEM